MRRTARRHDFPARSPPRAARGAGPDLCSRHGVVTPARHHPPSRGCSAARRPQHSRARSARRRTTGCTWQSSSWATSGASRHPRPPGQARSGAATIGRSSRARRRSGTRVRRPRLSHRCGRGNLGLRSPSGRRRSPGATIEGVDDRLAGALASSEPTSARDLAERVQHRPAGHRHALRHDDATVRRPALDRAQGVRSARGARRAAIERRIDVGAMHPAQAHAPRRPRAGPPSATPRARAGRSRGDCRLRRPRRHRP